VRVAWNCDRVAGGRRAAGGRIAFALAAVLAAVWAPPGAQAGAPADIPRRVIAVDGSLPVTVRDAQTIPALEPDVRAGAAYDSNPPQQPASFAATVGDGSAAPASPSGAVGPAHVLTVTEQQVQVQTRAGVTLSAVGLDAFWSSLGSPDAFDPRAVYDPLRGRFIVSSLANPNSAASSVLMAVTATGDPTGTWYRYRFEADGTRDEYWADAPSLGFNDKWITLQAGMFEIGTTGHFSRVFLWDLADTYEGGTNRIRYGDLFGFGASQTPAVTLDANVPTQDLLQNWKGNDGGTGRLRLLRIDGAVDAPMLTDYGTIPASVSWADTWPGAVLPQAGTTAKIQAGDARLLSVVRRGGSLWAAQTAFVPAAAPTRAVAQWWQLDAGTAAVRQMGRADGAAAGEQYAYPTIAVNAGGDALLGFSRFSAGTHPSAAFAFRYASDPPNTIRAAATARDGDDVYDDGANAWGAWSATQADPANATDLWTLQQHAATGNRWGTWWTQVHPAPAPSLYAASPLDFGEQRTATPSALKTITVLSDGQQPVTVGAVTLAGTNVSEFTVAGNGCSGQTLAVHGTCPLTIRFTPAADGPRSASLQIASTDPSGPDIVALLGTGVPPTPSFKATPSAVGFGNVVVGQPAPARSFTVTNGDAAILSIGAVTLAGTHAAEFAIDSDGCTGAALAPGEICSMNVSFMPADSGVRTASVRFTHNAPGGQSDVVLSGSGIPPGGEPRISFVPSSLWFPATEPGGQTTVPVRVYNIGTGTLIPGDAAIAGPAAFGVPADECAGAAIAPGSSCLIQVAFTPEEFGTRTGSLIVPGNVPGGEARLPLTATAVDATAPVSVFVTEPGEIVIGGGGAALSGYNVVRGRTTDRLSPILRVTVTFRSSLHDSAVTARLQCDATGRDCAWTAVAPNVPGFYTVTTESVDTWGNRETPGPPLEIFVL